MHFIRLISCIGAFLGLAMSGATAVAQVSLVPQAAARCTSSECSRFDAIVFVHGIYGDDETYRNDRFDWPTELARLAQDRCLPLELSVQSDHVEQIGESAAGRAGRWVYGSAQATAHAPVSQHRLNCAQPGWEPGRDLYPPRIQSLQPSPPIPERLRHYACNTGSWIASSGHGYAAQDDPRNAGG